MLKTILVPVDGSGYANRAIDYASDLASRYGAKIILLHAMAPSTRHRFEQASDEIRQYVTAEHLETAVEIYPLIEKASARADARAAEEILKKGAARAKDAGAGEVAVEYFEGDPAEVILDAVKSYDVDMIVMGNRGFSEMKGLLVGSVSQKILHHTEVPVTIVR